MTASKTPTINFVKPIHNALYTRLLPIMKANNSYQTQLWNHINKSKVKDIKKHKDGCFIALVMQTYENQILKAMIEFLILRGFSKDFVLVFDGIQVRRSSNPRQQITSELLLDLAAYVKEKTNFDCLFAEKPLTHCPELFFEKYRIRPNGTVDFTAECESVTAPSTPLGEAIASATVTNQDLDFAKVIKIIADGTYVFDSRNWWTFDKKWRITVGENLRKFIDEHVRPRFDDVKTQRILSNNRNLKNIVECLRTVCLDEKFVEKLDTNPFHIGCDNIYIDIRTGEQFPYTKDVLMTKTVGYTYDVSDGNLCSEWLEFVSQILPRQEELEIFHKYVGYCIRGDHPEKIFAFLVDKSGGYNGKSKMLTAILSALGDVYAAIGQNDYIYTSTGFSTQNGHNSAMFAHVGQRLVAYEELTEEKSLDVKTCLNTNMVATYTQWDVSQILRNTPNMDTSDTAFLDRMLLFPCRAKFYACMKEFEESTHEYKHLANAHIDSKFPMWRPYILEWLIQGYQKYEKYGFTNIPDSCKQWKESVIATVEGIEVFIEDNLIKTEDETDVVTLKELKSRMSIAMKKTLKTNENMICALSKILGPHITDTVVCGTRKRDAWKGWTLQSARVF
ncbi:hypothetical protein BDZ88DRAFT_456413 [Geranomyces variabilis]|nr:hypothetical protein BDZ88DRAFT_456413 [Geranomyces variabilis]